MKSLASFSLRARLALLSFATVLAVVAAFGLWSSLQLRGDMLRSAEAIQGTLVTSVADGIDDKLALRMQAAKLAAEALPGEHLRDAALLQGHLKANAVLHSLFDAVLVVDASGRIVADEPPMAGRVGLSIADRAYFKALMASGEAVVSEPVQNKADGQPTLVLAAPLKNAEGKAVGALLHIIGLTNKNFLASLRDMKVGRTGYFYLASKGAAGRLVVHPQARLMMSPLPAPEQAPQLHRALQGFEGILQGQNDAGVGGLFIFRQLSAVPWVLVAFYPAAEVYAPFQRRLIETATFAAAIAVLAGAIMWYLSGTLLRPLRVIREHMTRATSGLDQPVPDTTAVEEFVEMRTAYNELRQHRLNAEAGLRDSERRMRTIADNLPVLISYIGADRLYKFCNATYESWFLRPVSEVLGMHHNDLNPSQERREAISRALLHGERFEHSEEKTFPSGTKHVYSLYVPDLDADGKVLGLHSITSDVTQMKLNEQRLQDLARQDALTGLPNRRHFEETLAEAIARCARSERPMALLFLDIDHFKRINDTHGHETGDAVLCAFASRLKASVRATDTVSRLAGDEFTIIVEGLVAEDEASVVAAKIIESLKTPVVLEGGLQLTISSSIGVAVFCGRQGDPGSLVSTADRALYAAKDAGRATFAVLKVE